MGKQFKKPFHDPEEQRSAFIAAQITSGKCDIGYSSRNSPPQANVGLSQSDTVLTPGQKLWPETSPRFEKLAHPLSAIAGLRALLDLVALVVLDSPQI